MSSKNLPVIYLKDRLAGAAIGRHPWVFEKNILRAEGNPADGAEVRVLTHDGRFVARGLFNSRSSIRVRLYRWEDEPLSADWLRAAVGRALRLRTEVLFGESDGGTPSAYRAVFSEGDGLSGLTVDRYGELLVVQITSFGLYERREEIFSALEEGLKPKGILLKPSAAVARSEGLEFEESVVRGAIPESPVEIAENGVRYRVDLRAGQKTGFFFDQRENRALAARYARGMSALDLCSYTGGFALNLAKAGAASVLGVDSSEKAVEAASANAALNGLSNVSFAKADVLDWLKANPGRVFDYVILDPPRLAPGQKSKERGLRAYFAYNEAALTAVKPGGLFVTCSCSGVVGMQDLISVVSAVGRRAKRSIQVLHTAGQGPDHPVSAHCPESAYLKFVLCRVE